MKIRDRKVRALALLAGALLAVPATATVFGWNATLDQAQEVPAPTAVPGAGGSASGTVNDASGLLTWEVTFDGLSGAATGMHFHGPAPAGTTAGVVVNIGAISGLISPSSGSTTITPAQVAELLGGLWYVNVHTELNPPGEIRGQVAVSGPVAVSTPATLALLALGIGLILLGVHYTRR